MNHRVPDAGLHISIECVPQVKIGGPERVLMEMDRFADLETDRHKIVESIIFQTKNMEGERPIGDAADG